ncbi:MAG TPA: paraquat-inducible protein A [Acetobacteraceae bacterium]|nr:paraquat-inducible protein A [Acetobacteraceae bacterium]
MSDVPLPASLRECRDCGQIQYLPALTPGAVVQCVRCHATLRRTRRDSIGKALAFNLTALVLFGIATSATLLSVSSSGQARVADLFSGPEGLEQNGMWELALLVLFATFGAPLVKLLCTTVVLLGLHLPHPPRVLRSAFAWSARLTPWSMIEVYLLGVFVACVKLAALVQIEVGTALYALAGLLLVMVAGDFVLDRQVVWEAMDRRHVPLDDGAVSATAAAVAGKGVVGCHTCGQLSRVPDAAHAHCPRCGSALHARHPNSINHTWAFLFAALALYVPANVYPVLNITQLGASAPSTILGGVRELIDGGMWPLALLVFVASVAVPVLKIICMVLLLVLTQRRSTRRLRDRTLLYRIVEGVGRWSMIDVFMVSILVALVQFGGLVAINPGAGAIAFAGVVILTMFAAGSFDPRLMWDAAA